MRVVVARGILVLAAATFFFFGVAYLAMPERMTAVVGLHPDNPTARDDVRAVYGGLEVALALLLGYCAFRRERLRDGLIAAVVLFAGLGLARIGGAILDDGAITGVTLRVTSGELFAAVGSAFGLYLIRVRSARTPPAARP